jgi:hypothetical protein
MKKSTLIFTILVVAAFLVATALGLQNPKIPENKNELPESPESSQENVVSNNSPENSELKCNFFDFFSLKT